MRDRLKQRLLPLATVLLPVALLYLTGGLEFLERRWMDARFRLCRRPARSDILLVDIDPRSLQALTTWPWPRGYHATVLEQLVAAQARRVGFDIDFSSRQIPQEDEQLARAFAAAGGRVVLPVFHQWQRSGPGTAYLTAVEPLAEFKAHTELGSINVQPESDGLVRRYRSFRVTSGRLVPSFAAALAGAAAPDVDDYAVDFAVAAETVPRISYIDVLTGQFDRTAVAGRTVIVGSTAVELGDHIAAPVSATLPGPLLQALAYESLTQGRALGRTGPGFTLAVALGLVWLCAPLLEALSWRRGLVLTAALATCMLLTTVLVQLQLPLIVDTVPWLVALVGLYGYALVRRIDQQNLRLLLGGLYLRRTEHLMQHVVENSFDAIITVDEQGQVDTFNRAAQQMFRAVPAEVRGTAIAGLFAGPRPGAVPGDPLEFASGKLLEWTGRRADGTTFPVELVVTELPAQQQPRRVVFLRDITERRLQQEALWHQATHDPLTCLPNRSLLHQRLEQALGASARKAHGVAILLLDLDRFREINEALGHHTGDLLLQQVAGRLKAPLGPAATLARLGGDEFAILLPDGGLDQAVQLGLQLIDALQTAFNVEEQWFQIDTSIGIALFPDHGGDARTLLRRADVAMYLAKRKRRGLCVYDPSEDSNNLRHLTLRGDLRGAIEHGALHLAYQPKILAGTDRIVGVEALARWRHPDLGPIPPDEFIALAEQGGMIRQLTEWVCRTAVEQIARWSASGVRLAVSVNLSARNLNEEGLPAALERLLRTNGVPVGQLMLEITESAIMEDPELALRVVTRLRDLGIGISIDDFGTGYSALGYLMKLPAQELKIDRSFVMQMESDPGSAMIVHSTIELAHNLGLQVVAEGVESAAIWQVLKELGCDFGQGYHFSRPVPPEELLALVRAASAEDPSVALDAGAPAWDATTSSALVPVELLDPDPAREPLHR